MAEAPMLITDELDEGFHMLANVNGVVLAGRELEGNRGYKFVVWQRTPNHTGVTTAAMIRCELLHLLNGSR